MAIVEMKMYGCVCDNCGKQWQQNYTGWVALTDEISMDDSVRNDEDWHTDNGRHYCPSCFSFDDDDNLIIKLLTKNQSK